MPIIFLKAPTTPKDPYTSLFSEPSSPRGPSPLAIGSSTYSPHHVSVLEHTYILDPLVKPEDGLLLHLDPFPYHALVFTSQRAVSAYRKACQSLPDSSTKETLVSLEIPFYAIGPATAASLRETQRQFFPRCKVRGEESGNGKALADFILQDLKHQHHDKVFEHVGTGTGGEPPEQRLKVGFVTGEKHRDVLPKTLQKEGIHVEELVVYKIEPRKDLPNRLSSALEEAKQQSSGYHWIVLFSSTAAKQILHSVRALHEGTGQVKEGWHDDHERKTRIAAIGGSTAEAVRREYGLLVDAMADKPTPQGVREAIERAMDDLRAWTEFMSRSEIRD